MLMRVFVELAALRGLSGVGHGLAVFSKIALATSVNQIFLSPGNQSPSFFLSSLILMILFPWISCAA